MLTDIIIAEHYRQPILKGSDNLKNFLFLIDSNTMSILKNTHKSLI